LGKHNNRFQFQDADGNYRHALKRDEAQRLVDFGHADVISVKPPIIRARRRGGSEPKTLCPTSGCTTPASITARTSELNAEWVDWQKRAKRFAFAVATGRMFPHMTELTKHHFVVIQARSEPD
jgi:hypothetical protein